MYILVSQGIKIFETKSYLEAKEMMNIMNEDYYDYKQWCLDNNEPYADNEVFLYKEE